MPESTCPYCGQAPCTPRGKSCAARECQLARRNDTALRLALTRRGVDPVAPRTCDHCGNELPAGSHAAKRFCDQACGQRARKGVPAQRPCRHCGTPMDNAKRRQCGTAECERRAAARQVRLYRQALTGPALLEHRLRDRASQHRRRLLKGNECVVTARDWTRLLHQYRHCCAYCGERRLLTQEHIIPLTRGGRHAIGNLLPVCQSCNSSKKQKLLVEFRAWKDRRTVTRHAVEAVIRG